jgi:Ca2+-binding EF-hand superfamily protein
MCQVQPTMPTPRQPTPAGSAKSRHPSHHKDGVLLNELEKMFDMYAGRDGRLGAAEIAKIWEKCACNKLGGNLKEEDKRVIKESARAYLQKIDVDNSGRVDRAEFFSFMLGGLDRRGPLCQMQEFLQKQMEAKPEVLQHALDKFIKWDADGDGYVTKDELRVQMEKFLTGIGQTPDNTDARSEVDALLQAVDVDDDGQIDLWEFLAYSMGRRKVPVELLVYDITQGNSALFSGVLLGKSLEAIYHSSILVHGKEFWFGGNIFMSQPPMSQHFGPTLEKSSKMTLQQSSYIPELKCVHLGYTLMTLDEVVAYQHHEQNGESMCDKFTRQTYDVLTRNCNHYSDELAQVLCGNGIPEVITSQPLVIMDAPRMKVLVPLMNKWLGGFGEDSDASVTQTPEAIWPAARSALHDMPDTKEDKPNLVSFHPSLINGSLPSTEEQFGHISRTPGGSVGLRYFDPKTCNFVEHEAASVHLHTIDPKRPLGFDSIQSIAALAKGKKRWMSPLGRFRKDRRQPSQKAVRRS